jgi:hypothetical protein
MGETRWRQWGFIPITDMKVETDQTNAKCTVGALVKRKGIRSVEPRQSVIIVSRQYDNK